MSWATIKSSGSGAVRFALVIEGHPYIFVTDPALTIATDKGDRTVVSGLMYEGLGFSERALPGEGKIEARGMTFKFRSACGQRTATGTTDIMSSIFARRGARVGSLGGNLDNVATTIALVGSSTLENNTHYYIGTETIKTATSPTIARAVFDSTAQQHNITYVNGQQDVSLYDYPSTIFGRRVVLYAFGGGDAVTTLSNAIWRGIIAQPPRLDSDGMTWSLQCHHVSHALKQSLVGEEVTIKIVGYYHHYAAPIYFQVLLGSTGSSEDHWIGGFHANERALVEEVNDEFATALTEAGATSTEIKALKLELRDGRWQIICKTGSAAPNQLYVYFYSPLIGGSNSNWRDTTGASTLTMISDAPDNNTTYILYLGTDEWTTDDTPTISAYPPVNGLGGPTYNFLADNDRAPPDGHAVRDYSPYRIYIDHDWDTVVGTNSGFDIYIDPDTVLVDDAWEGTVNATGNIGGRFRVTSSGTASGASYIEVQALDGLGAGDTNQGGIVRIAPTFRGFLTGATTIRPVIDLGEESTSTDLTDFIENLVDRNIYANDGITPFLTDDDIDTTAELEGNPPDWIRNRTYAFQSPVTIEEVLSQELLLANHMLYTTEEGKLSFREIPLVTQVHPTENTVTGSKIITPAGSYGSWPGYQMQPQGLVAVVKIKVGYDPASDEWVGNVYEFRNQDLIARTKMRGVGTLEIAPRSQAAGGDPIDPEAYRAAAERLLKLMGREYASVRVEVPFTALDYLLGDVVSLTSPHVPDSSDGSRGITGVKAVVMGREWALNPARQAWGTLDLWILLDRDIAGYAPSAAITAQTDNTGNNWSLTCDPANATNILLSSSNDGECLEHFQDGDYIILSEFNSTGGSDVTGRIDGTPDAAAGTCDVQLDGVWVPGSSAWSIEYQNDNGSTAQTGQRAFAYVADNNKKLASDEQARGFT